MMKNTDQTGSPMTLDSMIKMFGLTSTKINGQTWVLDSEYTSSVIDTLLDTDTDSGLLLDDWTMTFCQDCSEWSVHCVC